MREVCTCTDCSGTVCRVVLLGSDSDGSDRVCSDSDDIVRVSLCSGGSASGGIDDSVQVSLCSDGSALLLLCNGGSVLHGIGRFCICEHGKLCESGRHGCVGTDGND